MIITFSIVNNPCACHPYMFITENYSAEFTIMSFWAPVLKPPAVNGIPKKSLNASLSLSCFVCLIRQLEVLSDEMFEIY